MAEILIRGMKMPDVCDSCKLNSNGRGCSITGTKYESDTMVLMDFDEYTQYTQRLKDCPLVELPEHGDLIDRDALMADGWRLYKGAIMHDGSYATHEMPLSNPGVIVVIPSNKEETE